MDFRAKASEIVRRIIDEDATLDQDIAVAEAALREAYEAGRNDQAAWVDTFTDDQQ